MSYNVQDDVNLDDLGKDELASLIRVERKYNKKKIKKLRRNLKETREAHLVAIEEREQAYEDLIIADLAIMAIVEQVSKNQQQ